MDNLWFEFLVDKFVTEATNLRCCGSCQGGCLNPAICAFVCAGYTKEDLGIYFKENKERLKEKFRKSMEG